MRFAPFRASLCALVLSSCAQAQEAPRALIEDTEPAVTQALQGVLEQIADGTLPRAQLTERATLALEAKATVLGAQLRRCPRPLALNLLARSTDGEDRRYQYRLACTGKALLLDAVYNKAARINRLDLHD